MSVCKKSVTLEKEAESTHYWENGLLGIESVRWSCKGSSERAPRMDPKTRIPVTGILRGVVDKLLAGKLLDRSLTIGRLESRLLADGGETAKGRARAPRIPVKGLTTPGASGSVPNGISGSAGSYVRENQ